MCENDVFFIFQVCRHVICPVLWERQSFFHVTWIRKNVETYTASNGIVDLRGSLSSARWPASLDLRENT
jgi:hypothetical protein